MTSLNVAIVPKQGQWYLHIDTKTERTFPFGLISHHASSPLAENKATGARPRARNRKHLYFGILTLNVLTSSSQYFPIMGVNNSFLFFLEACLNWMYGPCNKESWQIQFVHFSSNAFHICFTLWHWLFLSPQNVFYTLFIQCTKTQCENFGEKELVRPVFVCKVHHNGGEGLGEGNNSI